MVNAGSDPKAHDTEGMSMTESRYMYVSRYLELLIVMAA